MRERESRRPLEGLVLVFADYAVLGGEHARKLGRCLADGGKLRFYIRYRVKRSPTALVP